MMNIVIEYVKNLTAVFVPVQRGEAKPGDADKLLDMAMDMQFVSIKNSATYWYYFVDKLFLSEAKALLRQNGVNVKFHNSRYYMGGVPVLRIRKAKLEKNLTAKKFVNSLMKIKKEREDKFMNNIK